MVLSLRYSRHIGAGRSALVALVALVAPPTHVGGVDDELNDDGRGGLVIVEVEEEVEGRVDEETGGVRDEEVEETEELMG